MILKIIVSIFVVFAVSRAVLRYKEKSISLFTLLFWTIVWGVVVFFAWLPRLSDTIAHLLGLSRGVEALLSIAVVMLFYVVFRLYVKLEFVEHELSSLVRSIAIKNVKDNVSK